MLTKRQAEALEFIRLHTRVMGYAPSYEEMAEALGVASKSVVYRAVERLEKRGFVRRLPRCARAIEVIDHAR